VENLSGNSGDGEAYHGYWAQNINAVNTNFGSESDLIALSAALHARGMYLMVDIVTNHMGYLGCGTCVDYSRFTPFNSVWMPAPNDGSLLMKPSNLTTILSVSLITTMLPASRSAGREIIPSLCLI
jgi:Alpha amylase, catalytic domain